MLKLAVLATFSLACLLSAAEPKPSSPEQTRAAFLKIIAQPRVALEPSEKHLPATNGCSVTHFTFASETSQRVTGLLLKSESSQGRRPVVISMHGTGGNKESQKALLLQLAAKGFIGVAIDGRYHGERTKAGKGKAEYEDAIFNAYQTGKGHPFLYETAWDAIRLIDYLETRADVDAKRIGVIGFSKGGMETYLAAAADPRIAVAVPCIGVQSFNWALENNAWQSRVETFQNAFNKAAQSAGKEINPDFVRHFYDRVVPGIYNKFDGPAMLPLIAPRPLLVINGDSDARTPIPGLNLCAAAARHAYESAGAKDKFVLRIQENTGHKVTPDSQRAAIDWFVKWLKP